MLSPLSRIKARLLALLALGFLALPALALDLPAGVTQGASVEGVTEYSLQNGLRVLLAPDDSKPTTTVNMTYLVGARHENYGQTGMAHLLEHMLFRGTPTMHNALAEFSKRGLQANGSTTSDRTNYYASFAANPETLAWYLRWQADAMVNSLIAKEDLDSEMTVVRNEMERGENSPFQMLMQQMQAAAFQWHNYGHSTIGARSDVENVDIGQLQAFYRKYYQPDNAVLIVSGGFDPAATLQTIAQSFDKIARPTRKLPPEYTVEPVQDGERQVILRRQGGSPLIAAMFHAPSAASPDFTALDLGVGILADTPSGRLYHALVGNNLSAEIFGFTAGMNQPGYAFFGGQLEPGMDQTKALHTLDDTLGSVAKEPFTQPDLDRMRNKWLTDWSQTYADPASLASALSETSADGDWRLFFLQRDQVRNIQLADVQRVTAAYLTPSNRTNGLYIPTEQPVRAPQAPAVNLQDLLKDYKGEETGAAVAAFDPSPANINAATERTPLDLANGKVKLALLPKPTRGNRVEANLLVQFGTAETLKGQRAVSSAVASLLDHGTRSMSRQEIQDKFNALEANVSFGGGAGMVMVDMSTTKDHLPALTELVLHILREANFPARELTEYQRQANTSIKNAMAEPSALASRELARYDNPWPRDDVRYTPTFEEARGEIAAITQKDLIDFHARFYGAGTIEFAAVGAFDPQAVKAALAEGLKDWRKAPAYERVADPYRPVPPKAFAINTPDKANAFYLGKLPLKLQDTDASYPALYLANYLLGGSETSRLWTRVRVKEGLSYDVRSRLDASSYEPSGGWTIYAIHAPQNSQRLENAVAEELQRALKEGFTEEEVREGVAALLNYRKLARTRDGVLASTWINYLQLDRSFEWSESIDKALAGLTADKVNTALRASLSPADFSTAIAADESKQVKK
ncbi:M16 family metallopeptidase [Pollutimonas bauzanensis]|uniref:Zinc protease n=1 Tax=Pollutimonas bauzanensis TaxID=658167 RepID=A0A1M5YWG6_9BURK|nr:pitrilysin family protein [Pollutimonas bauzanensis]SHI16412.1 zinc protease [Pollutimonas bauzanensis]